MDSSINNNDFIKQFNNIINVIFFLLIIIFIILFYLIYKINNIKSLEGFDTTEDITNAVNSKYDADVDAIRNLSNIAKSLASTNTYIMPADLNVSGKIINSSDIISNGKIITTGQINTMGKTNYPAGWGGGVRTFDLYVSASIGVGGEDAVCKTVINSNGITTNSLKIGSWTIRENNDGRLEFIKDGTTYNNDYGSIPADHGFVAMAPDGNIWVNRSIGKRGWVSDIPRGTIDCDNINVKNNLKINRWNIHNNYENHLSFEEPNSGGYGKYIMANAGGGHHEAHYTWVMKE